MRTLDFISRKRRQHFLTYVSDCTYQQKSFLIQNFFKSKFLGTQQSILPTTKRRVPLIKKLLPQTNSIEGLLFDGDTTSGPSESRPKVKVLNQKRPFTKPFWPEPARSKLT